MVTFDGDAEIVKTGIKGVYTFRAGDEVMYYYMDVPYTHNDEKGVEKCLEEKINGLD